MKKFFKTMFFLGVPAFAGYMGFKFYRIVKELNKLEKELPEHLEGICAEEPTVDCMLQMSKGVIITIKVRLSEVAIAKYPDLRDNILEYVSDFHPGLEKYKLIVKIVPNAEVDDASGAHFNDPHEG
jgi:hypothetical protein